MKRVSDSDLQSFLHRYRPLPNQPPRFISIDSSTSAYRIARDLADARELMRELLTTALPEETLGKIKELLDGE